MPMRYPIAIIRTPDGYVKIGEGPYVKWTVTTVDGEKIYTLSVKEQIGDTPKEVLSA